VWLLVRNLIMLVRTLRLVLVLLVLAASGPAQLVPGPSPSNGNQGLTTVGRARLRKPLARRPAALAVAPDGSRMFALTRRDGALLELDPAADQLVGDRRIVTSVGRHPNPPIDVAFDPEGRHLFVVHGASRTLRVIDATSAAVVADIPVPLESRRLAFDFASSIPGSPERIYVTNGRDDSVLVVSETAPGVFVSEPPLMLTGQGPDALAVLADGTLLVGNRTSKTIEVVDPAAAPGSTTIGTVALGVVPLDLLVIGDELLVSTFVPTPALATDGKNLIVRIDLSSLVVLDSFGVDDGTDYVDLAHAPPLLAVAAAGSGTVLFYDDSTFALVDRVVLVPGAGAPNALPQRLAFVVPGGIGPPSKLYAVNLLRETISTIDLTSGPPFAAGTEIPLTGEQPRLPLVDLSDAENGEWFFRSVMFFNGTPTNPNPVTCATCHPDGRSDGANHLSTLLQAPSLFRTPETGAFGWRGNLPSLSGTLDAAFSAHGIFPGPAPAGFGQVLDFMATNEPPTSPFLEVDGSFSTDALAGKQLFEGSAECATCHTAPLFIPAPPADLTLAGGVGTGLVPANVPSLRGVWSTAPYLHDGSAATLIDVVLNNPGDQHGTTSTLSARDRTRLVAYVRSL
jgi:DNA-binding beta-propeller fold protein YncE